jgi:hypothetical protein
MERIAQPSPVDRTKQTSERGGSRLVISFILSKETASLHWSSEHWAPPLKFWQAYSVTQMLCPVLSRKFWTYCWNPSTETSYQWRGKKLSISTTARERKSNTHSLVQSACEFPASTQILSKSRTHWRPDGAEVVAAPPSRIPFCRTGK